MRSRVVATAPMLCAFAGFAIAAAPSGLGAESAVVVPTAYEAGHFYATPQTANGQTLKLLVDTGGGGNLGMYWITVGAAKRLGLRTRLCKVGSASLTVAGIPGFKTGRGFQHPWIAPVAQRFWYTPGTFRVAMANLAPVTCRSACGPSTTRRID